jgi:ubiquinone/menaquinone biosynthesis C-methylase UbiE
VKNHYLLGASKFEIDQLVFQGEVWRSMTDALLERVGVKPGWRCLDVGAGIGTVALPLAERVGPKGEVTDIEPTPLYAVTLREELARKNMTNVRVFEGDARRFKIEAGRYDLIFSRWWFSSVPDPGGLLKRLARGLKGGGVLAIEDYHRLDCAYYPNRPSFDAVIEATKRLYAKAGDNYRIVGELPALYYKLGLKNVEVVPHLRVGRPDSPLWKWGEMLFRGLLPSLIQQRVIGPAQARRFEADLKALKKIRGALFVVPTILDVAGTR